MIMSRYRKIVSAILALAMGFGLNLGLINLAMAGGTDVQFNADTNVSITVPGLTLIFAAGSKITSYSVTTTTLTVNLDVGSTATVKSTALANLANNGSLPVLCSGSAYSYITLVGGGGPSAVIITPSAGFSCPSSGATGSNTAPVSAPTATFSANPSTINSGQSAWLSWVVNNTYAISIDNNIGQVGKIGFFQVTPTVTTTYTLTASNDGGTITSQAIVTVNGSTPVTPTPTPTPTPLPTPSPPSSTSSQASAHPDGTLIRDGNTFYLIENGRKLGFRNAQEYQSYGYTFSQAVPATAADQALSAESTVAKAMEGTLVLDAADGKTVYMIGAGSTKRGFASSAVFKSLGYSFAGLPKINLADYPLGPVIGSATDPHPDGSLLLDGKTIWWITGNQLSGFESMAVFDTYGFGLKHLEKADRADLTLSHGALVKFRDGTLVLDSGTYYLISDGNKLPFASTASLSRLGYNANNAITASLANYTQGNTLQ